LTKIITIIIINLNGGLIMNEEVEQRIIFAANKLYEQNNQKLPSVNEVRKLAKVNMHDASEAMKTWRKEIKSQDAIQDIPDSVQQIGNNAIASIFQHANQIATESLRAAQSTWESEREELNSIIQEISTEHDAMVSQNEELSQAVEILKKQIDDINKRIIEAEHKSAIAEKLKVEIEHRARDLQIAVEHAHSENNRLRNEREKARNELSKTNELAERLSGRIDVLEKMEHKNSRKK
jgi:colicin import membrane protein